MTKTVSILGCGWLGLPLGAYLSENGFVVKGSTTREEKMDLIHQKGIDPYLIKVGEQLEGDRIDAFFDSDILILNVPPGRRHPNVEDFHPKQIQLILKEVLGSSIQKVLFVSSTGVYGNDNKVVTEEDERNPERASGKALVKVESILEQQAFKTTIIRMGGLVGGDRKAGRFLAGKKNVKNGAAPVNMIHLEDCIHLIHEILKQEKWGEVYNACADLHPTRKDFYKRQAEKEGFEAPSFLEGDEISYKIISNEKIKKDLSYTFKKPDPLDF